MGILNNDTQTVDAILTKQGKLRLAQGDGLNIRSFMLADDFINYKDWNTDHVSGSAYYGEALENLPLPEATTNSQNAMRFALATRERNLLFNPYIVVPGVTADNNVLRIEDQGTDYGISMTPKLINGTGNPVFQFSLSDETGVHVTGGTKINKSPSVIHYPRSQKVLQPATYEGSNITITADATDNAFEFLVSISEINSGASQIDVRVLVNANIDLKPTDKITI